MNQKKCPKCGEMNPAEAVMCWACYTPLTGGAVAAGGGTAAMATPQVIDKDDDKKPIAPWQLGVVGLALLLGVGFGISQFMGGSQAAPEIPIEYPAPAPGSGSPPGPVNPPGGLTTSAPSAVMPVAPAGQALYSLLSPPNPELPWGVLAIVPSQANISPRSAQLLAESTRKRYSAAKWKAMQIYVFSDRQSAEQFAQFQIGRRSNALGPSDYPQLAGVWSNCVIQYEINGGRAKIRYPSRAPNGWWNG